MRRCGWIGLLLLMAFRLDAFAQTEVLFSREGGFYDAPFTLSLGSTDWTCQIHYTLNGDTPTMGDALYETPLFLDEHLFSTAAIYTVPIAPVNEFYRPDSVQRAIVIRAAAFDASGQRVSEVATQTYLIRALGCDHHGLAVVSVCCDSLSLFDYDTGIFVPGALFNPDYPDWTGNYFEHGLEWERLANVEFYEPNNTGVNQQCGLRTHGNRARKAVAKGMKVYAREEYGKKRFKHRFFETTTMKSFKHLVLKPFSSLWPYAGVQDYLANRMALRLGLEAPHSRPVALYLNGEYWGIYFLQEKLDDHYLEDHFEVTPEACTIIGGNGMDGETLQWSTEVESGDGEGFAQLLAWLEDADLSDSANYARVKSLVDVDDFIDYQILETFIANTDWPANNFRCWQADGSKWRFAFFDGDDALVERDFDVFDNATYVGVDRWITGGESTLLFRRLLENNDFKMRFLNRVGELCATAFQPDSLLPVLNGLEQSLRMEIPSQIARFGYPESVDFWNWGCSLVEAFLCDRVAHFQAACNDFEALQPHQYPQNTNDFVVYPNPVTDEIRIKMLDGRSRTTGMVLCDMQGRLYLNETAYVPPCEALVIHVDLPAGVYVLTIGGEAHLIVKI